MKSRSPFPVIRRGGLLLMVMTLLASPALATPVEFAFQPRVESKENPFARDIWARVETPSGAVVLLPAFFAGDGIWAVRTRAALKGTYRFLDANEQVGPLNQPLAIVLRGKDRIKPRDADSLSGPITLDRRTPQHFVDGNGEPYVPFGGNLPWASGAAIGSYYDSAFTDFQKVGFNWTRIWMCHWGQLNLDWIPPAAGKQPDLGQLDLAVARRLDAIIESAATHGVRVQLVLQHHGQYTTFNNSNWADNPWNAANGGFLASPKDFFTDAQARQLTRAKYRYIVARWGYSPAILAWELFNEVMWTNSRRGDAADNAAVASWHQEMARVIRRYDVEGHLVTTSDDDLNHALWRAMDYYQPHLYATNMVLGVQALEPPAGGLDRPLFYGEMGDDNMIGLSSAQRASGFIHPILAWSGLFGAAPAPAQLWYVETLRENGRWREIASLGAFVRASRLLRDPLPFVDRPLVLGGETTPLVLAPGHYWHAGPNPEITVPTDGRETPDLMGFRRILTNAAESHPFPNRVTLHLDYPAAANATLTLARMGNRGGSLRVVLDDRPVIDERWPAATSDQPTPTDLSFPFRVGYGPHTLVIENPVGGDWIDLTGLDTGLRVPALAAVARRSPQRVVLWVHHRANLLSPAPDDELTPATGRIQLADLPAGDWLVTWWDNATGRSGQSTTLNHRGGTATLTTPPILRHGAAWLERIE